MRCPFYSPANHMDNVASGVAKQLPQWGSGDDHRMLSFSPINDVRAASGLASVGPE